MQKNVLLVISTLIGIVALILSWQAYQISIETRDTVLKQMRPNILLVDYGIGGISHYSGYQNSDHFVCVQGVRLKNAGGEPTSLTDYDVIVTYHEKSIQYTNDNLKASASAKSDISSAISSFNSAFFNKDLKISEKVSTGDFSESISFPVQIEPYSAIDLLLATHYVLDLNTIKFNQQQSPENALSISYRLHFASEQILEIPFLTCQSIQ